MAIAPIIAPHKTREIVSRALGARIQANHAMPMLQGTFGMGTPLPAYGIFNKGLSSSDPLLRVRLSGWRYPLLREPLGGIVLVSTHGKEVRFAGVCDGRLVDRIFGACACAEREFAQRSATYQPRLLELPAVDLYALWMFLPAGKSQFLPLADDYGQAGWMGRREMNTLINNQWAELGGA